MWLLLGLGCAPVTLDSVPADTFDTAADTALPACPTFTDGAEAGTLPTALEETSGLAASRTHAGTLWAHNDSGDSARVFAVSTTGADLGVVSVTEASALDWEDIAAGPAPDGTPALYLADIGDNLKIRPRVILWRIPEPAPPGAGQRSESAPATALRIRYPGGPADAETLLADPRSEDLYVVTKRSDGESEVLRYRGPQRPDEDVLLEHVVTLTFGSTALPGSPYVTGGDVAPDGSWVALRTLDRVWVWRRGRGSLGSAFLTEPCPAPSQPESQGESLAISAEGTGYFTASEGRGATLWAFEPP